VIPNYIPPPEDSWGFPDSPIHSKEVISAVKTNPKDNWETPKTFPG